MVDLVPSFELYKGKSEYIFPSSYYFVHRESERGMAVIVLHIYSKSHRSEFTLGFGWSRLGRLPEVLSAWFALEDAAAGRVHYSDEEYMNRVRMFLGKDTWWHFSSENPSESEANFAAAAQVIREKVVPFVMGALQSATPRAG